METVSKAPMIAKCVHDALADLKANDVVSFDVQAVTSITDTIIIASGTSSRHVSSIAENVAVTCKKAGYRPLSAEGHNDNEWVLIDLGDVIVHVMLPEIREYYALEKLWGHDTESCASSSSV